MSDANHTAEEKLVTLADEFFDDPAHLLVFVFDNDRALAIGAAIATEDGTKLQAENFDPEGVHTFYKSALAIISERRIALDADGITPPTEVTIVIDGGSSVITRDHAHSDMVDEEPINEHFENIVREWRPTSADRR